LSDVNRFEELVLPHVEVAHDVANELTRNPDDAEDVVQEACVRALKYIGGLHGDDARAWFLTIVRHAFYDWCKRNRPAEIARDDGTAIEMAIDDAAIDPEQAALRGAESRLRSCRWLIERCLFCVSWRSCHTRKLLASPTFPLAR